MSPGKWRTTDPPLPTLAGIKKKKKKQQLKERKRLIFDCSHLLRHADHFAIVS
jgi:hypothetical protein